VRSFVMLHYFPSYRRRGVGLGLGGQDLSDDLVALLVRVPGAMPGPWGYIGGSLIPTPPLAGGLVNKWRDGRTLLPSPPPPGMAFHRVQIPSHGEVIGELLGTSEGRRTIMIPSS